MFVEQLAEVRFAEPAVDARADLDAEDLWDVAGPSLPAGEIHLPEAAFAEQPIDGVGKARFRALHDLARAEEWERA
jgi:hypothetical protein